MSYTPTNWANGKAPAINADNLNKIENELVKLDNDVSSLAEVVAKPDITTTDQTTMPNSYSGRLLVEEIGGVCEQFATTGKNLWSYGDIPTGTASSISWDIPAGTYTFSTPTTAFDLTLRVYFEDGSNKVISLTKSPITFTLENDVVSFNYNSIKEATVANIQVEAGTVATAYEPYTGGIPSPNPSYPQEIKKTVVGEIRTHGKNFLNALNVFDFGEAPPNYEGLLQLKVVVPNGTYTISTNVTLGGNVASVLVSDNGFTYTTAENGVSVGVPKIITIADGNLYVAFRVSDFVEGRINVSREDFANGKYWVQLEKGTVATDYEPYKETAITLSQPIDLYGIGDVKDVIEDGKVKRKFVENVLPKDEWKLERIDETNSYIEVRHSFQNTKYVDSPTNYLLCTHVGREGGNRLILAYNALYMRFPLTAISTFEDVVSFLANNEVKYLIEYNAPTTEELPIADQIALNSLATYDGITYLEFDSEIEPTFKAEYGTSKVGGYTLEGMLAGRNGELYGKNYVDRITALEATVVNNI